MMAAKYAYVSHDVSIYPDIKIVTPKPLRIRRRIFSIKTCLCAI